MTDEEIRDIWFKHGHAKYMQTPIACIREILQAARAMTSAKCQVDKFSSRICEQGTRSCTVEHRATPADQDDLEFEAKNLEQIAKAGERVFSEVVVSMLRDTAMRIRETRATPADQGYAFRCDGKLWVVTDPDVAMKWQEQGFQVTPVNAPSATPADQNDGKIYQVRYLNKCEWVDTNKQVFDGVSEECRRIVYAQPPQNAADHNDIEQYVLSVLPSVYYMDPPDGGDVSILEQLRRMADDAAKYRASINAADHIEAQSVRDAWISVDERLPEIIEMYPGSGTGSSEPVLVYLTDENDNGEEIAVWRCFRGGQGDTTTMYWDWNSPKVTHWKPLPAPPQKPVSDEVKP